MINQKDNKKRVFLIDLENVHDAGFLGVESLTQSDEVVVFFSENAHKISLLTIDTLNKLGVKLSYNEVYLNGFDSLDKQLLVYLGMRIGMEKEMLNHNSRYNKTDEYIIIGEDKGYNSILQFCKENKTKVTRSPNLKCKTSTYVNEENQIEETDIRLTDNRLEGTFKRLERSRQIPCNKREELLDVISKSHNKRELHNSISKVLKDDVKVRTVYQELKNVIFINC